MAGPLTHEWIANLVLRKLKRKQFISRFENTDDYFFGAIAPDIRYIANSIRDVTHKPFGKDSLFEALKASTVSLPFVAGYECHLITDMAWANDKGWMSKSIYEQYGANSNNTAQKFALYGLIDDYFQAEADSVFPLVCIEEILRATDNKTLKQLGFNDGAITTYKTVIAGYLREPGIDTINILNWVPNNLDEVIIRAFLDQKSSLTGFLKGFKDIAVKKSLESLERYV